MPYTTQSHVQIAECLVKIASAKIDFTVPKRMFVSHRLQTECIVPGNAVYLAHIPDTASVDKGASVGAFKPLAQKHNKRKVENTTYSSAPLSLYDKRRAVK